MAQKAYLLGGRVTDDPSQAANPDDTLIDVDQEQDVRYWSKEFGVTEEEIRQAVQSAGPMVKDVRARLAVNRSY
jgi:hypothetical protein